ncbi:glycosyltransferase [Acidiphilium sp. AL]|uniref:glycosyltransferase n=1 Tax=Acidiphilium sp. AL TaxID=2871704 RepID=UPI0021CB046A|nr:glycosyltransferase [Acidiphilium sp. AL]MCU4159193.1 glycosyltransferase [Acidiphilium sp. AL]
MAGAAQGGAELFFERMTIALAQSGEAVLPVIRPDPDRVARLRAARLSPVGLRFGGLLDVLTRPRAARVLREFRADVAIAWMSRAAYHAPRGDWALIGRLGGYYDLEYFRRCDHLVGNTRDIVRWVGAQGWPRGRVHYLPNFVVDFAGVMPANRGGLGVPEGAALILALGRLHAVKGFDTLIRAMARLTDAHLVIAGEGPERAALESLIASLGLRDRVHLAGWRSDIGALLKAADIFVSSSRHEPLGNMVLEAFSASVPVVAAAAEGPREIIRDGVDGVLAPIGDDAALAAAMAGVLGDRGRAAVLAQAGRARFEIEFDQAVVVAAWRDFLRTVKR